MVKPIIPNTLKLTQKSVLWVRHITSFKAAERNERALIYAGTLTGDPVEDDNKIIKQFLSK